MLLPLPWRPAVALELYAEPGSAMSSSLNISAICSGGFLNAPHPNAERIIASCPWSKPMLSTAPSLRLVFEADLGSNRLRPRLTCTSRGRLIAAAAMKEYGSGAGRNA